MDSGQRRKQLSRLARRSPSLNWLDLPDSDTFYTTSTLLLWTLTFLTLPSHYRDAKSGKHGEHGPANFVRSCAFFV